MWLLNLSKTKRFYNFISPVVLEFGIQLNLNKIDAKIKREFSEKKIPNNTITIHKYVRYNMHSYFALIQNV